MYSKTLFKFILYFFVPNFFSVFFSKIKNGQSIQVTKQNLQNEKEKADLKKRINLVRAIAEQYIWKVIDIKLLAFAGLNN